MRITSTKETERKLYLVTIFPKAQPFSYEVELFVTMETNSLVDVEKMIYNHLEEMTNKNNQLVIEDKGDVNFIFKRDGGKLVEIEIMMIDKSEMGGIDIKYLRDAKDSFSESFDHLRRGLKIARAERADAEAEENA